MKLHLILAIAAITVTLASAQIPISPNAELILAGDGFKFTEGPAADRHGNVYFTDQPNDRILKWIAATGEVVTFLEPSGRANGMDFDNDGFLITCADEKGKIERVNGCISSPKTPTSLWSLKNPLRSPMASSALPTASDSTLPTSGTEKPGNTGSKKMAL